MYKYTLRPKHELALMYVYTLRICLVFELVTGGQKLAVPRWLFLHQTQFCKLLFSAMF